MSNHPSEHLHGSIERVTFHSETSGFCVLRIKVKNRLELITVVGNAANIGPGEYIECTGQWVHDKKHGIQFKAQELRAVIPTTREGIEKYLGSGMIRGMGPHFAKKLVQAFGTEVLEIIEHNPEKLLSIEGIGKKRLHLIINAWSEQKTIRDIMVFLQSHGVGTARAVRIFKTYGQQAVELVRENPYRLVLDIQGIGFKTADALAAQLNIPRDSFLRAGAGVRHVLQELCQQGHCAVEYSQLVKTSIELLEIPEEKIKQAVQTEISAGNLIADLVANQPSIFLAGLYQTERGLAQNLLRIRVGQPPWGQIDSEKAMTWLEDRSQLELSTSQKAAITGVLQNKISIITGGPGVGKTTVVNSLLKIVRAKKMRIALCAPTGRAAKRLAEATHFPAKTIHRLLEVEPGKLGFKHHQDNRLPVDFIVVDETSMVDVVLMYQFLKAVPTHAALLLVGDIDQLPSVGPGAVLADLIRSQVIPVIRLTEIFRQAAHSQIVVNAHRINQGHLPLLNDFNRDKSDFYAIYANQPEEIGDQLLALVTKIIPQRYGYDPVKDIQVLTPMHRGGLGSRSLNVILQSALNAMATPKIQRYGWTFAPGDKVIQNVNNYNKEVFNGDIGIISEIDQEESILRIRFEGREVDYAFNELDEVGLAYATSIHKSQGSEYPVVVLPLAVQHYMLLARNLLYTGVTRGKKLVILVGQKRAVAMAVRNDRAQIRVTKLTDWLCSGIGTLPLS